MKSDLEKEFKEAIDKNLSKEVGTRLQERLKELEEKEERLKTVEFHLRERTTELEAATAVIYKSQDLESLISKNQSLIEDIEKRERNLELTLVKMQLEESQKRADVVTTFVSGLVRNTNFRESVFDSEMRDGYYDSQNVWRNPQNVTKSFTKDSEAE